MAHIINHKQIIMADEQIIAASEQIVEADSPEAPVLTAEQEAFKNDINLAFSDEAPAQVVEEKVIEEKVEAEAKVVEEVIQVPDFIKDLGFESVEDAKAKIAELRAVKESAPTAKEIEFADEQSKKIHELIRDGKTKEVKQWLDAQELLSNVETMGNEDKLKLYIKMRNPKFDKELIEDEYNEKYNIDEDEFLHDSMKLRKEKLKLEQRIDDDVERANEYFSQYAKKVELPDITPKGQYVDKDYEDYKASIANSTNDYENVIVPQMSALTEDKVKMNFEVKDPNNQMDFGVSITPDKSDFEAAKKSALDFTGFVAETCYDKEGKFLPNELASFILLKNNFGKYAQSIARQAVNAERKRIVEDEKGVSNIQRDNNIPAEKNQFQKDMELAFS